MVQTPIRIQTQRRTQMKIPILILDTPTKNNRIYTKAIMEKAIEKYRQDFITEQRSFVVKTIPEDETVNLLNAVGIIKEISIEDNKVVVDVEFLPALPDAPIIEEALKTGKLHLRSSGIGSMHQQPDGTYKINDDYEFICCFVTNNPA